jgi:hypothetical protein
MENINDNKLLRTVICLILVLYASLCAPKLPRSLIRFFDNTIIKFFFIIFIAYIALKDPTIALVLVTILVISLQTNAYHDTANDIIKKMNNFSLVKVLHKIIFILTDTINKLNSVNINNNELTDTLKQIKSFAKNISNLELTHKTLTNEETKYYTKLLDDMIIINKTITSEINKLKSF